MASAAILAARNVLASMLGVQFGGKRDLYDIFGYQKQLEQKDFLRKYFRQDIASRIVDAPVDATWKKPPTLDGGDTFNTAWEQLTKDVNVWGALERADRLAGLGLYSILLIGFDDGTKAETPVTAGTIRKIIYLQPYAQDAVSVSDFVIDETDPRLGQPNVYSIETQQISAIQNGSVSSTVNPTSNKLLTHHSRVVHIADGNLDSDLIGQPKIAKVYNLLDDLIKTVGGSAETFWMAGNRGMQIDVDKEAKFDAGDAEALEDQVQAYQHELTRVIQTRGVKINNLGSETPDPRGMFDVILNLISGTTGIPKRVLLGTEAGNLASSQDRANWSSRIDERRTEYAEPKVLRPFVGKCVDAGVLPEPVDLTTDWPSAFELTPLEEGELQAQKGRALVNASKQWSDGAPIATHKEIRVSMGFTPEPEDGDNFDKPEFADPKADREAQEAAEAAEAAAKTAAAAPGEDSEETDNNGNVVDISA